ncbi:hypothetical protein WKT22_00276 [Candidatus Lokiarchaeum ossiferum]
MKYKLISKNRKKCPIVNQINIFFNNLQIKKTNYHDFQKIKLFFESFDNIDLKPIHYKIIQQFYGKGCFLLLDGNQDSFKEFDFLQLNRDKALQQTSVPLFQIGNKNLIGGVIGIISPYKPRVYQILYMKIHPYYADLRLNEYFHMYIEYNLKKLHCKFIQIAIQKERRAYIQKWIDLGYNYEEEEINGTEIQSPNYILLKKKI